MGLVAHPEASIIYGIRGRKTGTPLSLPVPLGIHTHLRSGLETRELSHAKSLRLNAGQTYTNPSSYIVLLYGVIRDRTLVCLTTSKIGK